MLLPRDYSLDAKCGPTNGGLLCDPHSTVYNGTCCSSHGYCGNTIDYCGSGCTSGCDGLASSAPPSSPSATNPHPSSKAATPAPNPLNTPTTVGICIAAFAVGIFITIGVALFLRRRSRRPPPPHHSAIERTPSIKAAFTSTTELTGSTTALEKDASYEADWNKLGYPVPMKQAHLVGEMATPSTAWETHPKIQNELATPIDGNPKTKSQYAEVVEIGPTPTRHTSLQSNE